MGTGASCLTEKADKMIYDNGDIAKGNLTFAQLKAQAYIKPAAKAGRRCPRLVPAYSARPRRILVADRGLPA